MTEHHRFSEDCAAYVLGALEQQEADALVAHMAGCTACRDEVARLRAVSEVLGFGVPARVPPPELRARVLGVVRAEAELFAAASASRGEAPARWWSRLAALMARVAIARPVAVGGVLGGAALALGIVLGAIVIAPGGSSTSTRVISASVAAPARWGSTSAPVAQLRESGAQGELVLSHLPAAPAGRIYEVWLVRGGAPQPTAVLFDATAAGTASVGVPDLRGATAVLVTAERRGGARVPTMAPLLDAPLS